tara:strand:+ start:42 stop:296 length:255 start_codon:yes stop_codon:yes gene_type:complete
MNEDYWKEKMLSRLDTVEKDLHQVKNSVSTLHTQEAVDRVHRENVEKRLSSIEGGVSKLTWLIITSLVLALMGFAVGGGLNVIQ